MNPFLKTAPPILTRRSFTSRLAYAGLGGFAAANTIRDLRLINTAMAAQGPVTGYKALVCLFLAGGNDASNMIVPTDTTTYDAYTAIRGNLTLPQASLLPLYSDLAGTTLYQDSDGHNYGFHPSFAEMQTLFKEDKLAVVMNIGTLVRPTTKAQYTSGLAAYRPPQLFSHSDQVTQWQTSIPDQPPATGWGGRMSDILDSVANPNGSISMSVSLNGANTWEVGNLVSQYQVSTSGAVVLGGTFMSGTSARVRAMRDILYNGAATIAQSHTNLQRGAVAAITENAIATGDLLNTNIAATVEVAQGGTWTWTTPFPNNDLGNQMKMIARLIQARGDAATPQLNKFNMARQIFFCSAGGYDTHTSQVLVAGTDQPINPAGAHYTLLNTVSECMYAFQRAMEQIGASNSVTTFTASDFGRTLPTNSQGSDHGWGSHHLVMGGAVNGGQLYGQLPAYAVNGPNDTGLGRWIPALSVDQHAATLARWFGVDSSEMATIFPNLSRFPGSYGGGYLGFMA